MAYDHPWPYPEYDLRATADWLERKAAKGRILCPGENLYGYAAFEKAEPQAIRYRLVPAKKTKLFSACHEPPSAEALELYRQMGWAYITNRGCFHIFASTDPDAPEPDTDPQILAMALKPARNRAILEAAAWLLTAVIWTFSFRMFYNAVSANAPLYLLLPVPYVILALSGLGACFRLIRYRRVCARGQFPTTRSRILLTHPVKLLLVLAVFAMFLFAAWDSPNTPRNEVYDDYVLYENFDGTLPFPDALELFPDAQITQSTAVSFRTFATVENWYYDAEFTLPDGGSGSIQVDYDRFSLPIFAKWYAWEMERSSYAEPLILCQGSTVYRIYTTEALPEAFLFGKE